MTPKYDVQTYHSHRWNSTGEKTNALTARRAARSFRQAGFKVRVIRIKREVMTEEEIR
jgi:hypothetical protein